MLTFLLPLSLALMTLVMGMTLELSHFSRLRKQPRPLLMGLLMQWLLLPLLAWGLIIFLALPPSIAAALILISAAPGGATSNMFSFLANGDSALSVSLTALVGLLAPFWMPFAVMLQLSWLGVAADTFALPLAQTIAQLVLICIVPVVIGMLIRRHFHDWVIRYQPRFKQLSGLLFMLVLASLVTHNLPKLPSLFSHAAVAMLLLATLALACGYLGAKLVSCSASSCRSLAFEVGIQNGAVAILVAYTQLGSDELAMMALLYGIVMNLPALALLAYFKAKKVPDTQAAREC
ncbi:bile acid:sodium symporter family protein [Oceanisphaera pacifica]|nr:bile acid:sodium symporter [Oceanisphaera pacifica]